MPCWPRATRSTLVTLVLLFLRSAVVPGKFSNTLLPSIDCKEQCETTLTIKVNARQSGLGMKLVPRFKKRGATIGSVVPGGPSAAAGVKPGDVLVAVSGWNCEGWGLRRVARYIQRHRGSVTLTVRRVVERPLKDGVGAQEAPQEVKLQGPSPPPPPSPRMASATAVCYAVLPAPLNAASKRSRVHLFECTPAAFGGSVPPRPGILAPVTAADPPDLCAVHAGRSGVAGHALLAVRGGCSFATKARHAQAAGAAALVVVDSMTQAEGPVRMDRARDDNTADVVIPLVAVSAATGSRMQEALRQGSPLQLGVSVGAGCGIKRKRPRNIPEGADAGVRNITRDPLHLATRFGDGDWQMDLGQPGLSVHLRPSLDVELLAPLKVALTGARTRVKFVRQALCSLCGGRGAQPHDLEECRDCGGTGIAQASHHLGAEVQQTVRSTCSSCCGYGERPRDNRTCHRCQGARVMQRHDHVMVDIPPGAPEGHSIAFPSRGPEAPGRPPGDLQVHVKFKPHPQVRRDGPDLVTAVNVTLAEALSGFTRMVGQLLGGGLNVTRVEPTRHGETLVIPGAGLPVWEPPPVGDMGPSARRPANADASAGPWDWSAGSGGDTVREQVPKQRRGDLRVQVHIQLPPDVRNVSMSLLYAAFGSAMA